MPTHVEQAALVPETLECELFKENARGKRQIWRVHVENGKATLEYGQQGGSLRKLESIYPEGKQGRTKEQQAVFETCRTIETKKRSKGYRVQYQDWSLEDLTRAVDTGEDETEELDTASTISSPHPMLAVEVGKIKIDPQVFMQPKLDGIRCMAHLPTGTLYSRQRKRIDSLRHIEEAVREVATYLPNIEWLDGELYKHGLTFSQVSSYVRTQKNENRKDEFAVEYHVYDCVSDQPFSLRTHAIQQLQGLSPFIQVVHTMLVDESQITQVHQGFIQDNYEGSMIRSSGNKGYEVGKRSKTLLKKKDVIQEEFRCVGFLAEKHSSAPTLGSIVMEVEDGGRQFKGRPAVPEEKRQHIWDNQSQYIGQMCTVLFDSWTNKNAVPRFPRVVGFRNSDDMGE